MQFHRSKDFTPTRPLNADDVIFSFMRQMDPHNPYHKVSGGTYANFESPEFGRLIKKIEKVDEHTVRFTLAHAEAPFLADLAVFRLNPLGRVCRSHAEGGHAGARRPAADRHRAVPAGAVSKDSRILYKAFPDYWQGKAKLDRLVFTITPDASVRYAKLEKTNVR